MQTIQHLLASDRSLAENKLRSLLIYCRNNKILLQMPKCEFVVINGNENDRESFVLDNGNIKNVGTFLFITPQKN